MKTYKELMASTKCPPGTRYDPKLKQCVAKKIRYKGHFVYVPENSEEYLRLTYGNDWRIQKRNFNWTDDTYNLEKLD